jgi:hypothetical protein
MDSGVRGGVPRGDGVHCDGLTPPVHPPEATVLQRGGVGGTALLGKITFERVKMFEDIFESVEVIFHGKGKKSKTSKEWKDKHFIRYINLIISLYPKKKNNHGISSIFGIETDEIGTYNKTIMANVLDYRIEECAFTFLLERGHFADMEGCITVPESRR